MRRVLVFLAVAFAVVGCADKASGPAVPAGLPAAQAPQNQPQAQPNTAMRNPQQPPAMPPAAVTDPAPMPPQQQPESQAQPSNAAPLTLVGGELNRNAVRDIQQRLQSAGTYSGPLDGVWGPTTLAGVQRFQQSRGLDPSGRLTPFTLNALGLDPNNLTMGTLGTINR